jgi:hypothetical protein
VAEARWTEHLEPDLGTEEELDEEPEWRFRVRLSGALRSLGFVVFHHDPDPGVRQFSVRHGKGYMDLYVFTPKHLSWYRRFPVLGIEVKRSKDLQWVRAAKAQVERYASDASATYWIAGKQVPRPSLYLVVTQDSWNHGVVYRWSQPLEAPLPFRQSTDYQIGCWQMLADQYDRALMPAAAVLRGPPDQPHFWTNARPDEQSPGPIVRYDLLERTG